MDAVIGWIFAILLAGASFTTVLFVTTDYRDFDKVVKQCTSQGFIQDSKTRITCSPEKTVKVAQ